MVASGSPWGTDRPAGASLVTTGGSPMMKLLFDTSKKMLSDGLDLDPRLIGAHDRSVTCCDPSFGVASASRSGTCSPVGGQGDVHVGRADRGRFVPATSQVMVWVEPESNDTAVFGAVTRKGPVPGARLTVMSAAVHAAAAGIPVPGREPEAHRSRVGGRRQELGRALDQRLRDVRPPRLWRRRRRTARAQAGRRRSCCSPGSGPCRGTPGSGPSSGGSPRRPRTPSGRREAAADEVPNWRNSGPFVLVWSVSAVPGTAPLVVLLPQVREGVAVDVGGAARQLERGPVRDRLGRGSGDHGSVVAGGGDR